MRRLDPSGRKGDRSETAPLDPIPLTLALWLGIVVAITGLGRLSENAVANAARAQADPQRSAALVRPVVTTFAPYGG